MFDGYLLVRSQFAAALLKVLGWKFQTTHSNPMGHGRLTYTFPKPDRMNFKMEYSQDGENWATLADPPARMDLGSTAPGSCQCVVHMQEGKGAGKYDIGPTAGDRPAQAKNQLKIFLLHFLLYFREPANCSDI